MTEVPLSLLHKKILYASLRSLAHPVSEYSFANRQPITVNLTSNCQILLGKALVPLIPLT
jgi:hypothetical protein